MRAMSVQQPYAWAIIHGGKDIENRRRQAPWNTLIGQRIAIHASRTWSDQGARDILIEDLIGRRPTPADLTFTFGAIIGTALVHDVHLAAADGCCDPWGWEQPKHTASVDPIVHVTLSGVRATPWIPCSGQLGAWRLPADVERQLEAVSRR